MLFVYFNSFIVCNILPSIIYFLEDFAVASLSHLNVEEMHWTWNWGCT